MSEWSDEDFHAPADRSYAELVACIAQRLSGGGGQLGSGLIEDLRLYIVIRKLQGLNQSQMDDELLAWGLPLDYVIELTSSTITAGNYGEVEVSTEAFVDGRSTGVNRNPTYGQRVRGSERAAALVKQAARMLDQPGETDPSLRFHSAAIAKPTMIDDQQCGGNRAWRQFTIALFVLAGLVVILAGLYYAVLR